MSQPNASSVKVESSKSNRPKRKTDVKASHPSTSKTQRNGLDSLQLYEFLDKLVDHKYTLYDWCESKTSTLVTLDSVLVGGLFLIIGPAYKVDSPPKIALVALTSTCLGLSLLISLWHVVPLMNAKVGNETNPRTVIGTQHYTSKEEFHDAIRDLDLDDLIRYTAYQAKGMNTNIWKNYLALKWAVSFTVLAIVGIAIILQGASFR